MVRISLYEPPAAGSTGAAGTLGWPGGLAPGACGVFAHLSPRTLSIAGLLISYQNGTLPANTRVGRSTACFRSFVFFVDIRLGI
jgi:hypothetical protein